MPDVSCSPVATCNIGIPQNYMVLSWMWGVPGLLCWQSPSASLLPSR